MTYYTFFEQELGFNDRMFDARATSFLKPGMRGTVRIPNAQFCLH